MDVLRLQQRLPVGHRWKFSTFSILHRHVAVVATIEAIIHSAAYTVFYYLEPEGEAKYKTAYAEPWFALGVVISPFLLYHWNWAYIPARRQS